MIRFVLRNIQFTTSNRKQNFFQLNPIYPDYGQKDFDIYNVQRKRVKVFDKMVPIRNRQQKVKNMIRDNFYMRKYTIKQMKKQNSSQKTDQDSGLPIGLNPTYDSFIVQYKKNKHRNDKVEHEFKTLLMSLIQKFKVKSELELIKLFRISLAHSKKNDFKQKIKGKLIQQAVTKAAAAKNDYFSDFFTDEKVKVNQPTTQEMNQQHLEEASFQQALKQIDQKIKAIQTQLELKKALDGRQQWDPLYGKKIVQTTQTNLGYDMNLKRGFKSVRKDQNGDILYVKDQDEYIRRRINKLFFLRKLQYLKKKTPFVFSTEELPMNLRDKQRIINELAHKYKQDALLIEPDLNDIYSQIDLALSKVAIRFGVNKADKEQQQSPNNQKEQPIPDKTYEADLLNWKNLDVQKVFAQDYYSPQSLQKENLNEKELLHVSPSAGIELSLNRVPFNLYRHSECQVFNVFTKYRHTILKDFLKDTDIDPKEDFNYFNLEQASRLLGRIKKPELDEKEKYYGHAHRKKCQAEVFVKHGTGVVTINGELISDYFPDTYHRVQALKPLIFSETAGQYDLQFGVVGGGVHGQSECCAYALARALMKINPQHRRIFSKFGLDSHDPRKKEPKRIGLYSARVRPPYVRR